MKAPHPAGTPGRRNWSWIAVSAALLALIVVAFWPGLRGEFVWDDDLLLLDHPNYRRPELILSSLRSLFIISPSYFRPLGYFSFFVDYSVFGPQPVWYHVENLVLHCASTLLLVRLLAVVGCSPLAAGAAAAVFAVHPSRVEGVVFISSRFDLLATFLVLCAILLHRRSVALESRGARWAAAVAYLLALTSKEMAVTFPLVAWYGDRHLWPARGPRPGTEHGGFRRHVAGYLPYAIAFSAYLGLRALVLGGLVVSRDLAIPIRTTLDHMMLVGKTIWGYVVFTLFPFLPNPVHYAAGVSATEPGAWLGLVLAFVVAWTWLTGHLRGSLRDGVLLFSMMLLPVINVVPIRLAGPSFMAERFLYMPLLGLVFGLRGLPWRRRGTQGLAILLLLGWVVVARHASAQWVDDHALFAWVARRAPESALGYTNLALEETRRGSAARAVALSESALVRDRINPDAWDNLGVAYYQLGGLAQAESCFVQALRLAPGHPLFSSNLAGTWRTMGRHQEALDLLAQVIARDSTVASAFLNAGLTYLRMGEPARAVPPLRRAAVLMEVDSTTWMTLAQALALSGDETLALAAAQEAVTRGLQRRDAGARLAAWGREALEQRRISDAARLLSAAGRVAPEDPTIANDLGVSLRTRGELVSAESSFSRAAALDPRLSVAWTNLGETRWLLGRTRSADSLLTMVLNRWPELADPYRHLGRIRLAEGSRDSADALFTEYLRLAPGGIFAPEVRELLAGP
ncbi:MAG: tetratricopeptide repeat protein [Candidatus Eisenbacteria bacterium]|jgi:Flp pilus assembly protein TadD|nr:tetratricopeptide repeat protein [Candidatus Eisenbacteria bacterium]